MKLQARKLFALAAAGMVIFSAASTGAFAAESKWEEKKQEMADEFYAKIDATKEQKQQLNMLHDKYDAQCSELHKSMWQQKKDLMVYIFSPNATKEEAMRREEQMEQSKKQLTDLELQAAFEKKAVLTPEQQKKAVAFFSEKAEKMEKKHADLMKK